MGSKRSLPRVLNQRSAITLLESEGWTQTIGGKHSVKMEKPGHRPITLPMHQRKDYSPALTAAILRQAGLAGSKGGQEA
ncbi:type II toxin-antitoxin system HicA family toxin [Streptomyces sp. NPDC088817]|uniref:type II toxin-antitoxin system HicA family toxin n=1 Tax=Streptomyces sp. NPDC088817 TaxID=3365907 RepID=UPI003829213F